MSVLKACRVPPLEEVERVEARDGSPVRESRATARLPWDGEARMRAMPDAVVGPAPIKIAKPEGGMVGFRLRWGGVDGSAVGMGEDKF